MTIEASAFLMGETGENPLKSLAASRTLLFDEMEDMQADALRSALAHAEIGLCGYSATFSVAENLAENFLADGCRVVLSGHLFGESGILKLQLRHAVELTLWLRLCAPVVDEVRSMTVALLAAFTVERFYRQLLETDKARMKAHLPDWLAVSGLFASGSETLEAIAAHLGVLLPLQRMRLQSPEKISAAVDLAKHYLDVANPTEYTLTQQGDERLLVDPVTGLNKYGCSPRPRPEAITFSSCTASSVSDFAYREAEELRHRLMKTLVSGLLRESYENEMEMVRSRLSRLLDINPTETEIILCSSGTDAELYPLVFLRTSPETKVVNIVVAPDEVGSGTVLAAGGRHFSRRAPLGAMMTPGHPVAGLGTETIEVVSIPIRDNGGLSLKPEELKSRIASAVTTAAESAGSVILHIVDNTKTGVVAPEVDFVLGLQKMVGKKLHVVVDACQFRLEKSNLHRYLSYGFCVLITGSKFFTGPPFCGALLMTSRGIQCRAGQLPAGFVDYFTQRELPVSLRARAHNLSSERNLGLLFRWAGAMNEMECFYQVPSLQRTQILQAFRSELVKSIQSNPDLHLLEPPSPERWHDLDKALWDAQPTIFSFAVQRPNGEAKEWLSIEDLRSLYYMLNLDCSAQLSAEAAPEERKLAAQRCHIGQPVKITHGVGALRIACGARLVYGIFYDSSLGQNPLARLSRELADARQVLAKISLILKYWSQLR